MDAPDITADVARYTSASQLRESFASGLAPSSNVSHAAAMFGRTDLLTVARENGCPLDRLTYKAAALCAQLPTLEWLHRTVIIDRTVPSVCSTAALGGDIMCLKFLRPVGFEWDLTTCCRAARNGFRDILEWCLENGCTTRDQGMVAILHNAAKSGSVETLEFAVKKFSYTVEMNDMSMRGGVEGGHIPILDWIRAEVLRKKTCTATTQLGILREPAHVRHGDVAERSIRRKNRYSRVGMGVCSACGNSRTRSDEYHVVGSDGRKYHCLRVAFGQGVRVWH